jgi:predicted alpha/beta-hydrolase family hydrolase
MSAASWKVPVGDDETTAVYDPAASGGHTVFVCAHGAGGSMSDRATTAAAATMRAHGMDTVRFNFLYKERGSGRPDPMPRLEECITAVVDRVRAEVKPRRLIIGGRSMGGRAASMLAAEGYACDGLLLLAYPLHPEGKPEKLRDAHLPQILVPTLCLNGTRDGLCRRDLMDAVLQRVRPTFRVHWLEGADHSWHVLKSSGRSDPDVLEEAGRVAAEWLAVIPQEQAKPPSS